MHTTRSGFLIALIVVCVLALYSFSPASALLKHSRPLQEFLIALSAIITTYGSVLLVMQSKMTTRWKLCISLLAALLLVVGFAAYVLYSLLPAKFLLAWHLDRAAVLSMWFGADVAAIAVIASFFAISKPRIPFAIASTLLLIVWSAK